MSSSLARNTTFMTVASIIQRIISFGYFVIVARSLGVAGNGLYAGALSFTTLFGVFVDLGLTNVMVREASRDRSNLQTYLNTVLGTKIFFGFFAYFIVMISAWLLKYETELIILISVSGLTMVTDSLHYTLFGALRTFHDLRFEAFGVIVSQLTTLIFGSLAIFAGLPKVSLMVAYLVPSVLMIGYSTIILRRRFGILARPKIDKIIWKFFHYAFPFALAAIFMRVYTYIDSVLLIKLSGPEAMGLYSIPTKIMNAFAFIPLALTAALYPRFSADGLKDADGTGRLFGQSFVYLLIIAFPISFGIGVLAPNLLGTFFSADFLPAIVPLRLLMIGLLFSFLTYPIGTLLNAVNRPGIQTAINGSAMVINILINVLLIRKYGATGAAMASAISAAIYLGLGYAFARRFLPLPHKFIFNRFLRIILSATLMAFTVYLLKDTMPLALVICIGGAVYLTGLFAFGAIKRSEIIVVFRKIN